MRTMFAGTWPNWSAELVMNGRDSEHAFTRARPAITRVTQFRILLAGFLVLYLAYGLHRLSLGVDFTDEGAQAAWPLRLLFGERPFTADPLTVFRPIEAYLGLVFRTFPDLTLYQFRVAGWFLHLTAFGVLAFFLFRLSAAPLRSLVTASLPFFVSHIFGHALPSYNTISSDCLTIALGLRGICALGTLYPRTLHLIGGFVLFLATFAHPALGLVAGSLIVRELVGRRFRSDADRRRLTPSSLGLGVFVLCWITFLIGFTITGGLADWWQRLPLARPVNARPGAASLILQLLAYPFWHDKIAIATSVMAAAAIGLALRRTVHAVAGAANAFGSAGLRLLAVVLAGALVVTYAVRPDALPIRVVQISLLLAVILGLRWRALTHGGEPEIRFLLLMSCLAAMLYATFTYYFSPHRSWISGILGLPFGFSTGFVLLLGAGPANRRLVDRLAEGILALAVFCSGWQHYYQVQRDGIVADLRATFAVPRLRGIRSTPERCAAVDALHAHLQPKLSRGEPLIAFDDCPLLYFLLQARPAYGLTWAVRYSQSASTLEHLNRELTAQPLPRYAIRTVVDLSHPNWRNAPRTNYANYPLNATVEANYVLEETIFPFEIWRLKAP